MALALSSLTASNNNADQNSYATASVSPTSGRLWFLFVGNSKATTPDTPTVTGAGLTWTQVDTILIGTASRLTLFYGSGTPSSGSLTIDFAGVTQTSCDWSVVEITGFNSSDPYNATVTKNNGAGATSATISMSAFRHANNVGLTALLHTTNEGHTSSDQTELSDAGHTGPARAMAVGYGAANDNSLNWAWATSDTFAYIGVEVRETSDVAAANVYGVGVLAA